jgi:hypothetical protein
MHAHDTHTTRNLEIIVIVKIKYFPYLGKISPTRLIKTCCNISYIKMLVLYFLLENFKIVSNSCKNKSWVISSSFVKNITP